MTEQQAVLKTYILWAWTEMNPLFNKPIYPNYKNSNLKYQYCPVCDYDTAHGIDDCDNCPMRGRWPSGKAGKPHLLCDETGSAYAFYHNAVDAVNPKDASLHAGDIAAALWKLYKELEDK